MFRYEFTCRKCGEEFHNDPANEEDRVLTCPVCGDVVCAVKDRELSWDSRVVFGLKALRGG